MINKAIANNVIPILKRHGALRASVFGSFATQTERPDSDLDLRIELPPGKSYFDFVRLKLELEETLKRKVDLVTYKTKLHPTVLKGILKEEIPLY